MELFSYDGGMVERASSSGEDAPRLIALADIAKIAAKIMEVSLASG
jgi:hypothetical protein